MITQQDAADGVYCARTINAKRSRMTKADVAHLEGQIHTSLKHDHPQSVRHVFYRMTDPRLPYAVEKSVAGYRQVQFRCKEMRRNGTLPYQWISDATRRGYHVPTYSSTADFIRANAGAYRADAWVQSPYYVETWCESRSIAGVIQEECERLGVSLYPAGGFASMTLCHEAADYIRYAMQDKQQAVILYVGDYDPAGVLIDRSIEEELRGHLGDEFPLTFLRIAITRDQIDEYDLPTKPRKATDRRELHITETVEAEAMPAHILRGLLRANIERFLPHDAVEVARIEENSAREYLNTLADIMSGGSGK